jgi:hypothetical protein
LTAVVGSGGSGAGERGVYDDGVAIAEQIGDTQAVAGGEAVDFGSGPGLKRIGAGAKNADKTEGVPGFITEFTGENDFVADDGAVDHAGLAGRENVALPGRILIPDELARAASERDEVRPAIVVEVGNHDLIASAEAGGDGVLDESGRPDGEERNCQKDTQTTHAPQYTFLFALESKP